MGDERLLGRIDLATVEDVADDGEVRLRAEHGGFTTVKIPLEQVPRLRRLTGRPGQASPPVLECPPPSPRHVRS